MSDKSSARTILVVDDDPDVVEQLTLSLAAKGYKVVAAGSQAEAEETLLGLQPDLAIFDLMMENMDSGFVLCHTVKKLYPGTPVILLTAVTAQTGVAFATQTAEARSWIKADTVLDKPARPEQIAAEVARLLRTPVAGDAHAHA
ncbi:MAG: Transcriptional regulatory protein YycF [Lentisphaerae bacterium ADurb.BinA184]|nr:MAG: Transcriptional regulatory protein YycF [Lentisphaerae bacterium ADurb.BinA184]